RASATDLRADPAGRMGRVTGSARTKHGADRVAKNLAIDGHEAAAIHGNKSQNARQAALKGFSGGKVRILVATDIAARGIDVQGITHVVKSDLPDDAENYVHRIGRTGRDGATGIAITLGDGTERPKLGEVEKLIRRTLPLSGDATLLAEATAAPPARVPGPSGRPGPRSARNPKATGGARAGAAGDKPAARPQGAKKPRWGKSRRDAARSSRVAARV